MTTVPTIDPGFFKAHGHGNDYLVFREGPGPALTRDMIRRICDRWRGPGADGIVLVESGPEGPVVGLRMFNPDGGEFERSGNGLRIAAVYLRRGDRAWGEALAVRVGGDRITMVVAPPTSAGVYDVRVEMGAVTFPSGLPFLVDGAPDVDGKVHLRLPGLDGPDTVELDAWPVSVGNPHAVLIRPTWTRDEVDHYGPLVATNAVFPEGTNVQFADEPGAGRISIQIWERGVGRTRSSGTSACAAVSAAVRAGLLSHGPVTVDMEGGAFQVDLREDWSVELRGPVEEAYVGRLTPAFLAGSGPDADEEDESRRQEEEVRGPGGPHGRESP